MAGAPPKPRPYMPAAHPNHGCPILARPLRKSGNHDIGRPVGFTLHIIVSPQRSRTPVPTWPAPFQPRVPPPDKSEAVSRTKFSVGVFGTAFLPERIRNLDPLFPL
jgi:hypothetical protein